MTESTRKWSDISGKAQGSAIGGALGIVTVVIIDAIGSLDALMAGVIVTAMSTIFSWLLPEVPPWKKSE